MMRSWPTVSLLINSLHALQRVWIASADALKQLDLAGGRALPVEPLGVAAGGIARGRCREEVADGLGEAARRRLRQDPAGFRRGDDIVDPIEIGDDDGGAAGHAFEQHIGPTLAQRRVDEEIRRAVDAGEALLRLAAK